MWGSQIYGWFESSLAAYVIGVNSSPFRKIVHLGLKFRTVNISWVPSPPLPSSTSRHFCQQTMTKCEFFRVWTIVTFNLKWGSNPKQLCSYAGYNALANWSYFERFYFGVYSSYSHISDIHSSKYTYSGNLLNIYFIQLDKSLMLIAQTLGISRMIVRSTLNRESTFSVFKKMARG